MSQDSSISVPTPSISVPPDTPTHMSIFPDEKIYPSSSDDDEADIPSSGQDHPRPLTRPAPEGLAGSSGLDGSALGEGEAPSPGCGGPPSPAARGADLEVWENSGQDEKLTSLSLAEVISEAMPNVNIKAMAKRISEVAWDYSLGRIREALVLYLAGQLPPGLVPRWENQHNPAGVLSDALPRIVAAYMDEARVKADELGVDFETFNYAGWLYKQAEAKWQAEAEAREAETETAMKQAEAVAEAQAAWRAAHRKWIRYGQEPEDGICYLTSSGERCQESRPPYDDRNGYGYVWVNEDVHKILVERYRPSKYRKEFDVPADEFWAIVKAQDPDAMAFRLELEHSGEES